MVCINQSYLQQMHAVPFCRGVGFTEDMSPPNISYLTSDEGMDGLKGAVWSGRGD